VEMIEPIGLTSFEGVHTDTGDDAAAACDG
jgi:hypothetical protein